MHVPRESGGAAYAGEQRKNECGHYGAPTGDETPGAEPTARARRTGVSGEEQEEGERAGAGGPGELGGPGLGGLRARLDDLFGTVEEGADTAT